MAQVGQDCNRKPVTCIAIYGLGTPSESWLHRQIVGLSRLEPRVLTWHRQNEDDYPTPGIPVSVCPPRRSSGMLRRRWRYIRNRLQGVGRFGGDKTETDWLASGLERYSPDVVIAHFGMLALRLLPVCRAKGIPLVAHFHGYDITMELRNRRYARRLAKYLPEFAACICVAGYQRDLLLQYGADTARVHVIPCGAPMDDLPVARDVGASPCRFIMVGRLVDKKRPDLSIRAFAKCAEHAHDVRLTVIGDGPFRRRCTALAHTLGVDAKIEWMGTQPNARVREALAESSVFVQHSVTAPSGDMEGWPVTIAEAAGAGLPVVSTRHAGITDQIREGIDGYLVDEGDWQKMADHMLALVRSPALRTTMGKAAREGMARFDVTRQIALLEDVLLSVAHQPVGRGR